MKIFKTALVLTLVGLLCGVVIGVANYVTAPIIKKNAEKRAQEAYKSFFSDLDGITEHEVIDSNVYVYIEVKKGGTLLGYVFKAKGTNQRGLIDLAVAYNTNGKVVGVKILESGHTAGFYDQYIDSANNTLVGLNKDTLVLDNKAGVTQSGDLLRTLLADVKKEAGKHIKVVPDVDLYKELFANKATVEVDSTFTATEKVTKKEAVKDGNGNVLGHVYTPKGTGNEELYDYGPSDTYIHLLVGVDNENKIVGVKVLSTNHTIEYLNYHNVYFESLVGIKVSEAPVDNVNGATFSRTIIRELIDALKAVLQ